MDSKEGGIKLKQEYYSVERLQKFLREKLFVGRIHGWSDEIIPTIILKGRIGILDIMDLRKIGWEIAGIHSHENPDCLQISFTESKWTVLDSSEVGVAKHWYDLLVEEGYATMSNQSKELYEKLKEAY